MKKLLVVVLLSFMLLGCSKIDIQLDPKFELIGKPELTLEVGEDLSSSIINDFVAKELGTNQDLKDSVEVINNVNTEVPGVYDIEYVLNYNGQSYIIKRKVTVNAYKNSDLELVLNGTSNMKVLYQEEFNDPFVIATNMKSGENITHLVETEGFVDVTVPGTYTIQYKISYRGVTKTKTRTVQVLEDPGLKLSLNNPNKTLYILGEDYIEYGVNIIDNFTGDVIEAKDINIEGNFNTMLAGSYNIEYSVEVRGKAYKIIRVVEFKELITSFTCSINSTKSTTFEDYYNCTYQLSDKTKLPQDLIVLGINENTGVRYFEKLTEGNVKFIKGTKITGIEYSYLDNSYIFKV